jgi:DNA-binding transcriptional LysR family regulator
LERTIGVRLLERNSHGIEPTASGRALLNGGVAAFDELHQAVKNIEFLADPTAGEVRIGCTPLLAAGFVSAVIDRLSRRYPRMVFHLMTGYVETLHGELSERNVDLLIARRFGPIAEERLGFEFLFDDSSVVAAGAQSPWARRRRIEFAELLKESWVLPPPGSEIASIAMEAFRANGVDYPRTTVVTDSPHARMSAGDRALCHNSPGFRIEISRHTRGDQGPARSPAKGPRAKRNRHPEDPHTQPRRAAFHRLCPRSRKDSGKAKMNYVESGIGR